MTKDWSKARAARTGVADALERAERLLLKESRGRTPVRRPRGSGKGTRMARDLVEAQIRAARERGDFDQLPGRGHPLQLDDLEGLSPEQRFDALLMRSIGEVPAKIALVREIRAWRALIELSGSEQERERARVVMREKVSELQLILKDDR